jgi:predicted nucleic acid-binding Zn ribbon protein
MPTYEFRCPDGSIIEARFKISEVPESIPTPDGTGVATRIISGGASLLFKGSGFYITDYGKDGKRDQRAGGASSSTESAPKSDGKSDTKSESKPSTSTPSSSSAD